MTKKEYLQQYKTLDNYINSQVEELEKWRGLATKITPAYSDMPKGGGCDDKIQTAVDHIIEIKADLDRSVDSFLKLKGDIRDKINTVDDIRLQMLLKYRYIDGLTFEQIAVNTNYCYKQVCRLHGNALNKLQI